MHLLQLGQQGWLLCGELGHRVERILQSIQWTVQAKIQHMEFILSVLAGL
jgi:hypothetical protein